MIIPAIIFEAVRTLNTAEGREAYEIDYGYGPGTQFDNGNYYIRITYDGNTIYKENYTCPYGETEETRFNSRIARHLITVGIAKIAKTKPTTI